MNHHPTIPIDSIDAPWVHLAFGLDLSDFKVLLPVDEENVFENMLDFSKASAYDNKVPPQANAEGMTSQFQVLIQLERPNTAKITSLRSLIHAFELYRDLDQFTTGDVQDECVVENNTRRQIALGPFTAVKEELGIVVEKNRSMAESFQNLLVLVKHGHMAHYHRHLRLF